MSGTSDSRGVHDDDEQAEGFLLLTLPRVDAWLPGAKSSTTGPLSVLCVTLPIPASLIHNAADGDNRTNVNDERDVWLVLRIGNAAKANPPHADDDAMENLSEIPLPASQIVFHDRARRVFQFVSDGREDWEIRVPEGRDRSEREDVETFEVILAQYAAVEEVEGLETRLPSSDAALVGTSGTTSDEITLTDARTHTSSFPRPFPAFNIPQSTETTTNPYPGMDTKFNADLHNQLVLVDESSGEIVGQLADSNVAIREDPSILAPGNEKVPVVIDLPDIDHTSSGKEERDKGVTMNVHTVPSEEEDFLMRGAHFLSRGIISTTSLLSSGISAASAYYISHSTPSSSNSSSPSTPLIFSSPKSQSTIRRVHHLSGAAVKVSSKTTGLINDAIESAVRHVSGSGSGSSSSSKRSASQAHLNVNNSGLPPPPPPLPSRSRSPSPFPQQPPPPPPYSVASSSFSSNSSSNPNPTPTPAPPAAPPIPTRQRRPHRLLNRVLLSTDLLLTTLENSGKELLEHGSAKLSEAVGHKYGPDAATSTSQLTGTLTNVALVYIDARGVGRRALLRRAGKTYVKAKLSSRGSGEGRRDEGRDEGRNVVLPLSTGDASAPGYTHEGEKPSLGSK